MSYNPTNWVNGQTPINDSNLNHIEQGIKAVSDLSDAQESKIADIANNQIPEEYLQQSVDNYIANNQAGLATKTDINNLDNKLSNEIEEISGTVDKTKIVDIVRLLDNVSSGSYDMKNKSVYSDHRRVYVEANVSNYVGESLLISGTSRSVNQDVAYGLYGFYDVNGNLLTVFGESDKPYKDISVVIPSGANTIVVNGFKNRFRQYL